MFIQMLRAKLHHARVTDIDINYIGSITIDAELLEQVGILPYERVQVVNVENGHRLETYAIRGEPGSGTIQLNGASGHHGKVGDRLIIMAYALVPLPVEQPWTPKVAVLDERNRIVRWISSP